MNKLHYVGFYKPLSKNENRLGSVAAIDKMDYVVSALNSSGLSVKIVSPSWIVSNEGRRFERSVKINLEDDNELVLPASWITKNRVTNLIKVFFSLSWLSAYLLFNVKRKDTIIVYHSPWLYLPILLLKCLKNVNVILEIEEIYSDVGLKYKFLEYFEEKILKLGDSYLLSTVLLKERLNIGDNFFELNGSYKVSNSNTINSERTGRTRLLYAGIIDFEKKGAFIALNVAKFLSKDYTLDIIGFGDIETLQNEINKHNSIHPCQVKFSGIFYGQEYVEFCSRMDIALSTQSTSGKYLTSSFPSKVVSYLGMGLEVVSGNIQCVAKSKIGELVHYYDNDNPENIAKVVKNIQSFDPLSKKKKLSELNSEFVQYLKDTISKDRITRL